MDGLTLIVNGTAVFITLVLGLVSFVNAPRRTVLIAFAAALLFWLTGCATDQAIYAELGAGKNMSFTNDTHDWNDAGGTAFYGALRYERPITERFTFVGQYSHFSQWEVGPPFDTTAESSLDHFGLALRFRLKEGSF